jgi:putative hydrolase of the HAD superfamily
VAAGRPCTGTALTPTRTAPDTASAIDSVVGTPG